jgi:hypothetical protein
VFCDEGRACRVSRFDLRLMHKVHQFIQVRKPQPQPQPQPLQGNQT